MTDPQLLLGLGMAVFMVALLYASVGHAGASGYIAVMGLAGIAVAVIRPTALMLNVIVGTVAAAQFARAGHFNAKLFMPFALGAVPLAALGGFVELPSRALEWLLGAVLVLSAAHFFWKPAERAPRVAPHAAAALGMGAAIGLLSGLTGTGGGIFLTPLLLLSGWAGAKQAASVSALFILCNSVAGLAGHVLRTQSLPTLAWPLAVAVLAGGVLGAWMGANRLNPRFIKQLLAVVLLIAAFKLLVK